jgi:type IV secretion system protein VirD4
MDLGTSVAKAVLTIVRFIFKPVMKFLIFTGLIFPALVAIFHEIFSTKTPVPGYIWVIAWGLCIYFLAQNMVRLITKDRTFNFLKLIFGQQQSRKERTATNPTIPKELAANNPCGVVFGRKGGGYVVKPETLDGHILCVGGVGSGKSSCLAIPSLLSWNERIFAIDIKGELYEKTKHKRPNVKVFNPLSDSSPGYNPYYLLADSRNKAQDAREIALAIMPTPKDAKDPFWIEGAQNIFTGAILHFYNQGYSFIDTVTAVQTTPIEQLITEIHQSDTVEARMYVNQLVGIDIKTLAGVATELANRIIIFATDPDIKACFSKSYTISPADLEHGEDVFINIPEHLIDQWKGILTLIVNQFLKHFERRPDQQGNPVLFLLDEAPRLGKIEAIVNGLATLRSKRVTVTLLIQSLAQLDMIYGQDTRKVIADTCAYKAILNALDADTQEYFSRLVGTYDKMKKSQNANFEQYTGMGRGTGESRTTEDKRIIKPEDFAKLQDIVLLNPFNGFCRIDKAPYYKDPAFKI